MSVDRDALKSVLAVLMRQYEAADESRRRATRDMLKARNAIAAIYAVTTDEPLEFAGTLAEACRSVVRDAPQPLTPTEIRDGIVALGYNLAKHNHPLASIHSVLKRLTQSGDLKPAVVSTTLKDGSIHERAAYEWGGQRRAPGDLRLSDIGNPDLVRSFLLDPEVLASLKQPLTGIEIQDAAKALLGDGSFLNFGSWPKASSPKRRKKGDRK